MKPQSFPSSPWQWMVAGILLSTPLAAQESLLSDASQRSMSSVAEDGEWIPLPPPSARYGHTAIYDPVRDRMVVFGGFDGHPYQDVGALSVAGTWSALVSTGLPPSASSGQAAIYDPVRDRMLVFGGAGPGPQNDVWALSLSGNPVWSQLSPSGTPPSPRDNASAIYDPVGDRMVVFGGSYHYDVWVLSLSGDPAWSQILAGGVLPSGRSYQEAIYDPVRHRMLAFGGSDGAHLLNDLQSLSLDDRPTWTLVPASLPPPARSGHTAIYDPVRDRIVVFGGGTLSGYLDDTWALPLAGNPSWTQLAPSGSPAPGRTEHTAVYDPVRDRMVVYGGKTSNVVFQDVWALSFAGASSWRRPPPPSPGARSGHTAIYDPVRHRMI